MKTEQPKSTPLDDLRKQALEHYEDAARKVVHYSSFVRDAILNYTPPEFQPPVGEGEKQDVVYFVEHKETHLWWYQEEDRSKPNFINTFNGSRIRGIGYETKDCWTNNPYDKRIAYKTREEAQKKIEREIIVDYDKHEVTEHSFMDHPVKSVKEVSKEGEKQGINWKEQCKQHEHTRLRMLTEQVELEKRIKALQEENERLKETARQDYRIVIEDEVDWYKDRIQVLEEALREARTFITEADDDGEGKEDWIILKTIEQALTGSQSKD